MSEENKANDQTNEESERPASLEERLRKGVCIVYLAGGLECTDAGIKAFHEKPHSATIAIFGGALLYFLAGVTMKDSVYNMLQRVKPRLKRAAPWIATGLLLTGLSVKNLYEKNYDVLRYNLLLAAISHIMAGREYGKRENEDD